jgi:UDP-GlcNAc:undecaprenyl-phosphate GlcNAc-1-phosphate transferase
MANYKTYYVLLILACGTSLLLTPLIMRLATRLGAMDHPGARKVHRQPIPLLGGLAVALGVWLPILALFWYDNRVSAALRERGDMVLLIFLSGLAMLFVGVIDDLRGLNARKKFLVQLPVAIVLVVSGIQFKNLTIPGLGSVDLGFWGPILTVMWLVGITNAINLVDGIDGLAAGVAMFAGAASAMIALHNNNVVAAVLMTALVGACFGFLPFNFNPARIFLGDTGSLFLGMTLAVCSMTTSQKGVLATSLLIPILVLGFPIVDTLLAMTRRVVQGKSMFSSDAGHIHHRMLAYGLSHRQAALAIYAVCILCGLVGLVTVLENNLGIAIGFAGLFFVLYVGLRSLGYVKTLMNLVNSPERLKFKTLYYCAEMTKCKIGLAADSRQLAQILETLCREFEKPGFCLQIPGANNEVFRHRWFRDQGADATGGNSGQLASEAHEFTNTGVKIEFFFVPRNDHDELHLEKRNLLGSLAEVANDRVAAKE